MALPKGNKLTPKDQQHAVAKQFKAVSQSVTISYIMQVFYR